MKLVPGLLSGILLLSLFQLVNFLIFSKLFDTSGGSSSIQTKLIFKINNFPLEWSHWQVFIFILIIKSITILIVASGTMFISSFAISLDLFFLLPINIGILDVFILSMSSQMFYLSNLTIGICMIILFFIFVIIVVKVKTYIKMKNWQYD